MDLIYSICEHFKFNYALESGVAYGWSSSAILQSISKRNGFLISVDMPMIKQNDYHLIGIAVEKKYYKNWKLIREPDINGIIKALKIKNEIDFFHYDSDKSYYGRKWAYKRVFDKIKSKGVFISDDIQDNEYFKEFVENYNLNFYVIKFMNKYIGIIFKE